jgi:hypothetical protein
MVDYPFDRFVAHLRCLELFSVFAVSRNGRHSEDVDVPASRLWSYAVNSMEVLAFAACEMLGLSE